MSDSTPIVCKPTPWFLWRAVLMFAMFAGFCGWFAYDGLVGYKKKNEAYFLKQTFDQAQKDFTEQDKEGELTVEKWDAYAKSQKIAYPEGAEEIMPAGSDLNASWPDELSGENAYTQLKADSSYLLWEAFTGKRGMDSENLPKAEKDAGSIQTQKILSGVCGVLAAITLFFFIRTMKRRMVAHDDVVELPGTGKIPYTAIKRLDKRKWDTKGLAVITFDQNGEDARGRVDGLTYGGFKKEDGEPAEKVIELIQSKMNGEVIEYIAEDDAEAADESLKTQASEEESK